MPSYSFINGADLSDADRQDFRRKLDGLGFRPIDDLPLSVAFVRLPGAFYSGHVGEEGQKRDSLVYVGSSPSERSPCVITVRQDEAAQTPELRDRFAAEARKAFGMLPTEVAGATKSDDTGRVMDVIGPWIRGTLINVEWLLDLCAGFVHSPWDVVTLDGEASGILHLLRKMRQHYENRPSPDEPANPKSPELSLAALILTCTEALWVNRKSITIAPSVEVELPQEATPFRIFMERLFGDAGWGIEIDRARTANTSTWIFTPAIFISEDQVGEDQGSQA